LKFSESLISEYAKKIYGFAYSKTRDTFEADDLSQEIVLALCGIAFPEKQIDNMDAYIYKICRYTWSKYLRKNKPHRESLCGNECIDFVEDDCSVENDFIAAELCDKLRREIMYLGKIRREAIILFYYDGKSGEEISAFLGIPAATVRWHLHKAKNELKERFELTGNDNIYRPVRLSVGHYGWENNDIMHELKSDTLMQNICCVCFGTALAIEEISRTLGVAAVYLEDKLDKLCSMEYMTKSEKGKYRTNFFIRDAGYQIKHSRYQLEKTMPIALAYYNVVKSAFTEITQNGFTGTVSDDILMWDIMLYFMMSEIGETDCRMIKSLGLEHGSPIRPDGTRHWVRGAVSADEVLKSADMIGDDLMDFFKTANGCGIKGMNLTPINVHAFQLDSPFLCDWRTLTANDISAIRRICALEVENSEPNEFDKSAIAELVKKGYAVREDDGFKLLVPYFNAEQARKLDAVLKKYADAQLDRDAIDKVFFGYVEHMKKLIPDFICENERNHYLTSYDPQNTVLYLLMKNGKLKTPSDSKKKYICTILWEK